MRSRGGAIFGVILILFGLITFPLLLDAFDDIGRTAVTSSATVATGVGGSTGNITLNSGLHNDHLDNIIAVSSTNTSDDPAPSTYNTTTDALTVSGLAADDTRTVAVNYYAERDTGYLSTILPIAPFFIFTILVVSGGMIIYRSVR